MPGGADRPGLGLGGCKEGLIETPEKWRGPPAPPPRSRSAAPRPEARRLVGEPQSPARCPLAARPARPHRAEREASAASGSGARAGRSAGSWSGQLASDWCPRALNAIDGFSKLRAGQLATDLITGVWLAPFPGGLGLRARRHPRPSPPSTALSRPPRRCFAGERPGALPNSARQARLRTRSWKDSTASYRTAALRHWFGSFAGIRRIDDDLASSLQPIPERPHGSLGCSTPPERAKWAA